MDSTKRNTTIKNIVIIGVFAAIISIISALPIGFNILGVPATLQTFAMAFAGYTLGYKKGTLTVIIYILLGAIGVPVFNGFNGGFSVILGVTGGFIIGFIFIALLCGIGINLKKKISSYEKLSSNVKYILSLVIAILLGILGLIICHIIGCIFGTNVLGLGLVKTATLISIPYLPKDILSVVLAYLLALAVREALVKAKLSDVI